MSEVFFIDLCVVYIFRGAKDTKNVNDPGIFSILKPTPFHPTRETSLSSSKNINRKDITSLETTLFAMSR